MSLSNNACYARVPKPGVAADAYFCHLYDEPTCFRRLAGQDPPLNAFLSCGQLDFADPAAVMQLTKSLLKVDFNLDVDLPNDRLCPPIPNRHNYVLWLKALLDSSSYREPGGRLLGLDVGTGASCIYPLLACAQREWSFVATDIDDQSLLYAARNIERNALQTRIRLMPRRRPEDDLIPLNELGVESLDFVMTNPPFYSSADDMAASAAHKARPPFSVCTGAAAEMVTAGGEVGFVSRMLRESLVLRTCVQWYTAMLGKLSSVHALVTLLREHQILNFALAQFVQGTKTRRWAIAWSFGPLRPSQEAARGLHAASCSALLPPVVETRLSVRSMGVCDVDMLAQCIDSVTGALDLLSWHWDRSQLRGTGRAWGNVWGRAWRRRRARGEAEPVAADSRVCVFGFCIALMVGEEEVAVMCRWTEGQDQGLYDSFQAFLTAKLASMAAA